MKDVGSIRRTCVAPRPTLPLIASPAVMLTPVWVRLFGDGNTDGKHVLYAREEVLLRDLIDWGLSRRCRRWACDVGGGGGTALGLADWVELDRIHQYVAEENVGQPISVVQRKKLELIQSLVSDGMFVMGDVKRNVGFTPWNTSLDESLQRIRDVYVPNFHDENTWMWFCWLDATEKELEAAKTLAASQVSAQDS